MAQDKGFDFIKNIGEATAGFIDSVGHTVEDTMHLLQFASEELRGPANAKELCKTSEAFLTDMKNKGLLDDKVLPAMQLTQYEQVGTQAQAEFANGRKVIDDRDYRATMITDPKGNFGAMQWNHVGGKVTRFSDTNNEAVVVEPRQGGSIIFDEKQNTVTTINANGEKFVEKSRGKTDQKFFDSIASALDFDLDWTNGSHFNIKLLKDK